MHFKRIYVIQVVYKKNNIIPINFGIFTCYVTLCNLVILTYPYHIDLIHPGDMLIENFIPQTYCVGFISSVVFRPVGHSPVGHVCLGL